MYKGQTEAHNYDRRLHQATSLDVLINVPIKILKISMQGT